MDLRHINLDVIDLDDRAFDLAFARDYAELKRSVATVGVLQPLLGRECVATEYSRESRVSGFRFQVVCGFGRVRAASELGLAEVPARVLEAETTDADCLRLAFFDNLAHRRFNPMERAILLRKFHPHVGRERLIADYLPLLGMRSSAALHDRTMALNRLVASLQRPVAEGRIEANVAARLATLPEPDQEGFAKLLERCRPSVSVVREWTEALIDVARREGCEVGAILAAPEIASIVESDEMSSAQATATVRGHLHRLRYPTYARHEEQFAEARKALHLPPSMRLEAAPQFEADEMRLEIRFRDKEELSRVAAVMTKWFDDPSLVTRLWPGRL